MSYAAFKVVHSPGGIDFCTAAHLRHAAGTPQQGARGASAEPAQGGGGSNAVPSTDQGQGEGQGQEGAGAGEGGEGGRGDAGPSAPELVLCSSNVVRVMALGRPREGAPTTLEHVCEHRLNGVIESLAVAKGDAAMGQRDALVLTFREGKISVLEYDFDSNSLVSSSLHYLESPEWATKRRGAHVFPRPPTAVSDPLARCAAVLLYRNHLHVLLPGEAPPPDSASAAVPAGTPLDVMSFRSSVSFDLKSHGLYIIKDLAFLPTPEQPTLAVLWQDHATWAGRMGGQGIGVQERFVTKLSFLSLNTEERALSLITTVEDLPFNAYRVSPLPIESGTGTLVLADHTAHCVTLQLTYPAPSRPAAPPRTKPGPSSRKGRGKNNNNNSSNNNSHNSNNSNNSANGDPGAGAAPPARPPPTASQLAVCHVAVSPEALQPPGREQPLPVSSLQVDLEAARAAWLDSDTAVLATKGGQLAFLSLQLSNRSVQSLDIIQVQPVVQTSCLALLGPEALFLGSRLGDSILVQCGPAAPRAKRGRGEEEARLQSKAFALSVMDSLTNIGPLRDIATFKPVPSHPAAALSPAPAPTPTPAVANPKPSASEPEKSGALPTDQAQTQAQAQAQAQAATPAAAAAGGGSASDSLPVLLACSGHAKNGALSVLTQHVTAEVLTQEELPGCKAMWAVCGAPGEEGQGAGAMEVDGAPQADQHHSYIVLSFPSLTMVLETAEELREAPPEAEFFTAGPTILAANLFGRKRIVQVWGQGVRVLHGIKGVQDIPISSLPPPLPPSGETPPGPARAAPGGEGGTTPRDSTKGPPAVLSASVSGSLVLLLLTNKSLWLLRPEQEGGSSAFQDPSPLVPYCLEAPPGLGPAPSDAICAATLLKGTSAVEWVDSALSSLGPQNRANGEGAGSEGEKRAGEGGAEAQAGAAEKGGNKGGRGAKSKGRVGGRGARGGRGAAQGGGATSLEEAQSTLQSPMLRGSAMGFCAIVRMSGRFQILALPSGAPLFQSPPFSASPLFLRHTLGLPPLSHPASDSTNEAVAVGELQPRAAGGAGTEGGSAGIEGERVDSEARGAAEGEGATATEARSELEKDGAEGGGGGSKAPIGTAPMNGHSTDPPAPGVPPPVMDLALASLGSASGAPFLVALLGTGALVCYKAHLGHTQSRDGAVGSGGGAQAEAGNAAGVGAGAERGAGAAGSEAAASPGTRLYFQRVPLDHLRCPSPEQPPSASPSLAAQDAPEETSQGHGGAPGRRLIAFENVKGGSEAITGLFVTGDRPLWLMCLRQRIRQHLMDAGGPVAGFAPLHIASCPRGFLLATAKLGALLALHGTTGSFARNLQRLMVSGSTPPQDLVHLLRAAYSPYEPYKQRYGDLERAQLESTVSSMDLRRAAVRGYGQRGVELSAAVRRMEASVPALIVALEASVDRSLDFTGGSESLELVRALDEALSLYISKLLDCLRSLRPVCGLAPAPGDATKPGGGQPHPSQSPQQQQQGGGSESASMGGDRGGGSMGGSSGGMGGGSGVGAIEEEEEWSIIQGTLQLLSVSERLGTRSSMFEASLRASISRLAEKLTSLVQIPTEAQPDPQPGADPPSGPSSSTSGGSQSQAGPYAVGGGLGGPGASASAQGQGQGAGGVLSVAELEKRLVAYVGACTAAGPSSPGGPSSVGSSSGGHTPDVDMALVRLASMPEKLQRLKSLIAQSQDPRFHALPRGVQRVQAFRDAVSLLVFEVLLAKVRRQLADVARMPEWGAKEEVNAFDLPSFSAYPLPYITSIGEYLLTLPQQLEPLAVAAAEQAGASLPGLPGPSSPGGTIHTMEDPSGGGLGGGEDAGGYFVREWMSRVAEGAMALFVEQLRGIPALSERGAQQLSADIEYLHSVLSVLFVAASPALSTFQACLANPRDQLASFIAAETGPTGALDGPTARLVAKMRGVVVPMGTAGDKK